MQWSSISAKRPRLEGVFGPLSKDQDILLRDGFRQVDAELTRIARRLGGHTRSFGTDDGLNLTWSESGQLIISGGVTAGDKEKHGADFLVKLWPAWAHEEPSETAAWVVEAEIYVDCQHAHDHESMDLVWERSPARCGTPLEAVHTLLAATRELASLTRDHGIEYWTMKARD